MRVQLHGLGQVWDVRWGIQLLGADPTCDIQLSSGGVPPVAGVLVRWLEWCILASVGPARTLESGGKPLENWWVDLHDIARKQWQGGPAAGWSFRAGAVDLALTAEVAAPPAPPALFSSADYERLIRAAIAYGVQLPASAPDATALRAALTRLVGSMSRSHSVKVVDNAADGGTIRLRSISGYWAEQSISLERPPECSEVPEAHVSQSIAFTLDEAYQERADDAGHAPLPLYQGHYVSVKGVSHWVGALSFLDRDDFLHTGVPADAVRHPAALVTTIEGKVQVVDLADPPRLTVNGEPSRRATLARSGQFELHGAPLTIRDGNDTAILPARIFRTLALRADPVTQAARLGLLLPRLTDPAEQRLAYLAAALSGAELTGVVAARLVADGWRLFTPCLTRWGSSQWKSHFENCRMFDRLFAFAQMRGGELHVAAPYDDPELAGPDGIPEDRVLPYLGPLSILIEGGETLIFGWRHVEGAALRPGQVAYLRAILRCLVADRHLEEASLKRSAPPGKLPVTTQRPALRIGRTVLPLASVNVIGSGPQADLRLLGEESLSSLHALVIRDVDRYRALDFRSFWGIQVNDTKVSEALLTPGARLKIGRYQFTFEADDGAPGPAASTGGVLPAQVPLTADPALVARAVALMQATEVAVAQPLILPGFRFRGKFTGLTGPAWIGRAPECTLVLDDPAVSRRHALIVPAHENGLFLWAVDFASSSGIFVNGHAQQRAPLKHGDVLRVGKCELACEIPPGAQGPADLAKLGLERLAGRLAALGKLVDAGPVGARWTALGEALSDALDLERVLFLRGHTLAGEFTHPTAFTGGREFLQRWETKSVLAEAKEARRTQIWSLEAGQVYRQADQGTINISIVPLADRAALTLPLDPAEGGPDLLVATTRRAAGVAFRDEDLAVLTAFAKIAGLSAG